MYRLFPIINSIQFVINISATWNNFLIKFFCHPRPAVHGCLQNRNSLVSYFGGKVDQHNRKQNLVCDEWHRPVLFITSWPTLRLPPTYQPPILEGMADSRVRQENNCVPCRRSSGADTIQRQWSRFTENCRAFLVIQSPITCTCLFWMPMRSDQLVNRVQAWFIVLISLLFSSASKVSLVPLILHVTRTVVRLLCVSNDYKK